MAKILLIAQGDYIAQYARQIQETLPDPGELEIIIAHMEEAVRQARRYVGSEVEVIIARSISAEMLRQSRLPIPVVEIPISNEEILRSIKRAQALAVPGTPIGFLGFVQAVSNIQPFLDILDYRINIYEVTSSQHNLEQIEQAKRDGVTVLIGGARSVQLIENAGLKSVLMDTSAGSIAAAYSQAREILKAISLEKKKNRENAAILDSVSDAIVSLDADGRLITANRLAAEIFGLSQAGLAGRDFGRLFPPHERDSIREALKTGEETMGNVIELKGGKYAMRIVPIMVGDSPEGAIVTLQEIRALQRMEASVRSGLYQRGNVAQYVFEDIKGESEAIRGAVATARKFAGLQSNVLLVGETGTGKELLAQSIHNASARRERPFVAVNCGAIPSNLIESELFGYEEGAFTGSRKGGRMGLFELAHNGTIFLDEISEMDQAGQVNLLRALQERRIRRVGGSSLIPVDVRVIAASNANLHDRVRDNLFRRDLYYRLSVLVVRVPSLRERHGDVSILAGHFIRQYNREFGKDVLLSEEALAELEAFDWDGNIRQLRNFCERLVAVADEPAPDHDFVRRQFRDSLWQPAGPPPPAEEDALVIKGEIHSKARIRQVLRRHKGNRSAAAKELGICRATLWKHLQRLGLSHAGRESGT